MILWKQIIDIGHTSVMVPLAAAIAAWLLAARAPRLAFSWGLMFAAGLGLVALSKIAFLGWDTAIPEIRFKALSGHALCSTAVIPVLFFVVLQRAPSTWRSTGVFFGILVSMGIGVLLVHFRFHTPSEVIPSFVLGTSISLGYMRLARALPAPHINQWTVPLSVMVFVFIFVLKPSLLNRRLGDVAVHLSGRDRPYQWSQKTSICKASSPMIGEGSPLPHR